MTLESVPLIEDENSLNSLGDRVTQDNAEFYRKKLIGQSVAASFMARFDQSESENSKLILTKVFELFPNYELFGDLTLMYNLYILKFMDSFRYQLDFTDFDTQLVGIGRKLLTIDKDNPYANYYMANYHQVKGTLDSTSFYYNRIVNAKNFSPWWYTKEAKNWINEQEGR